jgi:eukaryotic-like serine/threonine-protein kinase
MTNHLEPVPGPASAGAPIRPSPFVGRAREMEQLREDLEASMLGRGRCVLLAGEAGIGKSRVVDELAHHAHDRKCAVLWGRCWEAGGAPAYWLWVQPLRSYLRSAVSGSMPDLGAGAARLAEILPELTGVLREIPPAPELDPETARFMLFEAASRLLRAAAEERPLVVILEDLHAADTPSLLLLQFVASDLLTAPMLVIGTYRDTAIRPGEPLATSLEHIRRATSTRFIELRGLGESEVHDFIQRASDAPPSSDLVSAVYRETEGNPLFVGEVVRLLDVEGRLHAPVDEATGSLRIPHGLRQVISRRLGHLSDACVALLTEASVLGREFRPAALERAMKLGDDEIASLLDEAVMARVLADVEGQPDSLRFSHALIRDALYEDIPLRRRPGLHMRAGEALEALYAADPEPHLAELAHHFVMGIPAGGARKAIDYARRAGDRAVRLLAYEEAVRHYETGLRALEQADPRDHAATCDLLMALGDALARSGAESQAKEAFLEASRIAKGRGMTSQMARAALGYGGRFVWEAARGDRHLATLLEDALAAMGGEESELRMRVMARLAAGPLRDRPERAPRDELSARAVEMARRLGDPAGLAYALDGRYAAVWWPDNIEDRMAIATELVEAAVLAGDRERELQGHHYQCLLFLELGDMDAVDRGLEAQLAIATEIRQPAQLSYVTTLRATLATFQGRLEEAEGLAGEAFDIGKVSVGYMQEIYRALQLYLLRREQDRLAEVEPLLAQTSRRFPTYFALRCALAHLRASAGRESEAHDLFDPLAADGFRAVAMNDEWIFSMGLLAETAVALADMPRCEEVLEALLPYGDRLAVSAPDGCTGSVSRILALLAGALQRPEEAAAHFERAIAANRRAGARPWLARTLVEYADFLLGDDQMPQASGGRDKAVQLLGSAMSLYAEMTLPAKSQSIGRRLAQLGEPVGSGDRVRRVFMFTDIVRSTQLVEAVGDEAWEALIEWHDRTLRDLFATHGGKEIDHTGDGFFVAFIEPEGALACSVEIQRTLQRHRQKHGFAPQVRIGLHASDATQVGTNFRGKGVHEAARIAALAGGGEILASKDTVAGSPFQRIDPRTVELKGISEPVEVVTVEWR